MPNVEHVGDLVRHCFEAPPKKYKLVHVRGRHVLHVVPLVKQRGVTAEGEDSGALYQAGLAVNEVPILVGVDVLHRDSEAAVCSVVSGSEAIDAGKNVGDVVLCVAMLVLAPLDTRQRYNLPRFEHLHVEVRKELPAPGYEQGKKEAA